jgi:hypothetical protein
MATYLSLPDSNAQKPPVSFAWSADFYNQKPPVISKKYPQLQGTPSTLWV